MMENNRAILDKNDEYHIDKEIADLFNNKDLKTSSDKEKRKMIKETISGVLDDLKILITSRDQDSLIEKKYREVFGLGPLQCLVEDCEVTEIMVNGPYGVFIEKKGKLRKTDIVFSDMAKVKNMVDRIINPLGLRLDISSPIVDGRLKDGSRINAVISPICKEGISVTIRKFNKDILGLDDLIRLGTIDEEVADFLKLCVRNKKNIIVSGATSTGKTTFLNLLTSLIVDDERLVTVEETLELDLRQENLVRLESRPANLEGEGAITLKDLIRNSLRMRPDRIIIGEIRGPEAVDVLQAMNTGHEGSMTTVHANSSRDMISRMETMLLMSGINLTPLSARMIISSAIDLIIQLKKDSSGRRIVSNIGHLRDSREDKGLGHDLNISDIFFYDRYKRKLVPSSYLNIFLDRSL